MGIVRKLLRKALSKTFITDRHGIISRSIFGGISFCVGMVVTRDLVLAREVARKMRQDHFAIGLERLSWYMRRSWPSLTLSVDPLYLFCSEMTGPELVQIRAFLMRRAQVLSPETLRGELCFISASQLLEAVETPGYPAALAQFSTDAQALLQVALAQDRAPTAPTVPDLPKAAPRRYFTQEDAETALRDVAGWVCTLHPVGDLAGRRPRGAHLAT